MHRKIAVLVAAGALAVPAAAQAHVTLQPKTAQAGSFTVLDVRVPNERDKASTIKLDVQLPAGFASVSYQPVPGWTVKVIRKKLTTPIQTDDGPITEGVSRMIWTGSRKGSGKIGPGQFMDFPISVQIPGKAGDVLTFKALQTYSNGEIVRWIGAPSADLPAPQVKVTGATTQSAGHAGMGAAVAGDGGDGNGPGAAAVVVGGVLVAASAVALTRRRRRPRTART
jgi:periplasmic copper chaperone A